MAAVAGATTKGTRTAKGTQTREAILERAVDLASEEGLEGLTIGRLADELGLSKSGLFGHFGSKEGLQLATIEAAADRFVREVVEPVRDVEPGAARLRALCDHYIGYLEREVFSGGCFWAAAAAEFDARPGPVRDAVEAASAAWLRGLESEAALAGVEDPAQLAFELQSLAQGANFAYQLFGDREAFARARRAVDRLLPPAPSAEVDDSEDR
jgi:AcrR family transcriptional regulator